MLSFILNRFTVNTNSGNLIRTCYSETRRDYLIIKLVIEGFGGKRALGVLCKSELCLNHSKLRMQFCLGAFNKVLYVFLLKFASFSKYYVCKKPVFVVMSARDHKDGNFT